MTNNETAITNATRLDNLTGKVFYRYDDNNELEKLKVVRSYSSKRTGKEYYVLMDKDRKLKNLTPVDLFAGYTAVSPTHVIAYHSFTSQIGNTKFTNLIVTINKIRRDYEPINVLVLDVFRYFNSVNLSRGRTSGGVKVQTRFYPTEDSYIFGIKTERFDSHSVPIITALDYKLEYWQYCYLDNPLGDTTVDMYQIITDQEKNYSGEWEYLAQLSPVLFKDFFVEHNILELTDFGNLAYEFLGIYNVNHVLDLYNQRKEKYTLDWFKSELRKAIEDEYPTYGIADFIAYVIRNTSNPTFTIHNPFFKRILKSIDFIEYKGDDFFERVTKIEERRDNRVAVRIYLGDEDKVIVISYDDYASYDNNPVMTLDEINTFFKTKK